MGVFRADVHKCTRPWPGTSTAGDRRVILYRPMIQTPSISGVRAGDSFASLPGSILQHRIETEMHPGAGNRRMSQQSGGLRFKSSLSTRNGTRASRVPLRTRQRQTGYRVTIRHNFPRAPAARARRTSEIDQHSVLSQHSYCASRDKPENPRDRLDRKIPHGRPDDGDPSLGPIVLPLTTDYRPLTSCH